jgi:hypothetical protein
MTTVTTIRHSPKPFAWSYSKLKNFESCPKRHYEIDIAKSIKEPESEQLRFGNMLHEALAKRIGKGVPLPTPFAKYESWAARMATPVGIKDTETVVLVEQKLAITKDFAPCDFFDRRAWYRGIGDVIKITGPVALVADWKSGKIQEDGVQLALMAQCVFAHHPGVQRIRSEFIWLKEDATTRADFSREDMVRLWVELNPRIEALEHAHNTTTYPAKPGALCRRWCPVSSCPHHGA